MEKRVQINIMNTLIVLILLAGMVGIIANYNRLDSGIAFAKGKSGNSMKLISMGPTATQTGVKFQVQKNGESAIWIKGDNLTKETKIVWGTTTLNTFFADSTTLTALVPLKLFAKAGNYNIYLFNPKTKRKSNSLIFSVVDPRALKLNLMGPTSTKVNKLFQIQPNGVSAMWIKGDGITKDTKIYWGEIQLDTYYGDPTTLTAFVPTALISKPGKVEIMLVDLKTKVKSNKLIFNVE